MWGPSPRLDPPEPPEPCPTCGSEIRTVVTIGVTHHDDGAVTGDLVCPECGEVLVENELLREPEDVRP